MVSNQLATSATTLAQQGWETRQNADTSVANAAVNTASVAGAQAGIAVAVANLHAQEATVQRLQALTAFKDVAAPFDGVITARNVDVGDLVTADASGGRFALIPPAPVYVNNRTQPVELFEIKY